MKQIYLLAIRLYEESRRAGAPPDRCQCCGAAVAEGVKGCWELYAGLGERAYADPAYATATFYGVDAHALQHPEIHGIKNNAAHLLRLHWIFSRHAYVQANTVPRWWQAYLQSNNIPHLDSPPQRGDITVVQVAAAPSAPAYAAAMQAWGRAVYDAWAIHHGWAERTLAALLR